ncbi:YceD family protein [Blastochloris tepida]|uniref:Phosphodiesterase n=1 Tax=Blastochloris tepida TaxID=2233851 RepID=A0A348G1J8_9HYPH|nr:DUF177 domain-containing protein [Blastochloris tepida]BBF93431.1 hypothetical protein BLTE_21160 [Blastochloris tepida]
MTDPTPAAPWTHSVLVAQLPPESSLTLEPTEETRAALARHVGALSVPELKATLELVVDRKGTVTVTGRLTGRVVQACVVTLEPMESAIDEAVDVRFAADAGPDYAPGAEVEFGYESADPPEPIINGRIDLGAILTEFFSLGVDPYPRKPDAAWQPGDEQAHDESPFAALARLKDSGAS